MAHATPDRLDDEILQWGRVLTHVHTVGNSQCSGQQSVSEVIAMAKALGYDCVVLNEHTGAPQTPRPLGLFSREINLLLDHAASTDTAGYLSGYDIRFGLECNTVPLDEAGSTSYRLDTPLDSLNAAYVIGSLHGDSANYRTPKALMSAIEMLCTNPRVDALGHITRSVAGTPINWGDVTDMAAATGTMVELNLNQWFKDMGQNNPMPDDSSSGRFWRKFLDHVAESRALPIIGADIHNAGMWPTSNPVLGWETSTARIADFHKALSISGFTPGDMVGSSVARFDQVLKTPKANRLPLAA